MDSHVSREVVIEAISDELDRIDHVPKWIFDRLERAIRKLPSAEEESFEWCTDCKEYDQEAHCCHRWSKMIKKTVEEIKHAPTEQDLKCEECVFGKRTGKWIQDRSGAYCCSECMEPCAGYIMMRPRDKFCKMCGAKMEVDNETD